MGPFDLSGPYRLPGGTEMDALATGYERQRSYHQGRVDTEVLANRMVVSHTSSALGVVDPFQTLGFVCLFCSVCFALFLSPVLSCF